MLKPPFFSNLLLFASPQVHLTWRLNLDCSFNVPYVTSPKFTSGLAMTERTVIAIAQTLRHCNIFVLDWRQNKSAFCHLQISKRASTSKKGQPPKEPGKGQLWDGIVSIILVEGKKMIPMDDSGRSVVSCICPIFGECCGNILYNQYKRTFFPHDIHFQYKLASWSWVVIQGSILFGKHISPFIFCSYNLFSLLQYTAISIYVVGSKLQAYATSTKQLQPHPLETPVDLFHNGDQI